MKKKKIKQVFERANFSKSPKYYIVYRTNLYLLYISNYMINMNNR